MWWSVPAVNEFFVHNQGSLGSCAGFAMANARMVTLLHQTLTASEQYVECINPFVTWCKSKGCSTIGGQTMAAMASYGNTLGSYPVSAVGEYSDRLRWNPIWDTPESIELAGQYQIGIAEVTYSSAESLADEILFVCKHRHAIFFGATSYVDTDGTVRTCGGHAQAYGGYNEATNRIGYLNSWGDIYSGLEPVRFATLITRDQLVEMCRRTFDPYAVTYVEAPYDINIVPTLEVG